MYRGDIHGDFIHAQFAALLLNCDLYVQVQ
jgi:hypothetical protein